mmetsp:Transcript_91699/g.255333  ORF Transcript_91699/g.255333 Transcript_91699/m.255333 type:complete len:109 (-) Transcript_91699:483-809(-)
MSCRNAPSESSFFISESKDPNSTTCPSRSTAMTSALRIVDSRCAIIMTVLPLQAVSMALCTCDSLSASKALVASSKITIGGFFKIQRATATLCFCPPDSIVPRGPTTV